MNKRFELGKYYRFNGDGQVMHIIGALETFQYGWTYIAEVKGESNLRPVGYTDDAYAVNWVETDVDEFVHGCRCPEEGGVSNYPPACQNSQ